MEEGYIFIFNQDFSSSLTTIVSFIETCSCHLLFMGNITFQAGQILYLENQNVRLYCELIEHVVSRDLFWVRPLLLVEMEESSSIITDLQDASDLLWPVKSFQTAFDTEIINYLGQLWSKPSKPIKTASVKQILHRFIRDFWSTQYQTSTN